MYKINSILVLIGVLIASLFSACTSSGRHTDSSFEEKVYEVEAFDMINLQGAYDVRLIQGEQCVVSMNTTENNHERIRIEVENNVLTVSTKGKHISTEEVQLNITFKDLKKLDIEGGAFLKSRGYLELEDIAINIEGGAHIDLQLTAKTITTKAEGGVNMQFEGVADVFYASSEGAANIDADKLKARKVDCRVTGVGNASVYATEELDARVEGVGKIGYRGDPVVNKQVNGIGLVYRK